MALGKLCTSCGKPVSPLGDFVKISGREVHISCYTDPIRNQEWWRGRGDLLGEQADAAAATLTMREKEAAEAAIKAEALRILNTENARRIAATKKATDELRAKEGGEAPGRLAILAEEVAIGNETGEYAAEEARKAKVQAEQEARTKAESERAKALDPCVRCGKPGPHGEYHPRHCSACWNSAPPVAEVTKQDLSKLEIPNLSSIRPIELD